MNIRIGDAEVSPGRRAFTTLKVATLASGMTLKIPVHIVHGTKDGPKLLLVSALHGKEWNSVDVVKLAITSIAPESLRGTLIAIPVANPISYQLETNYNPAPWEGGNANRSFPGDLGGGPNEKVAYVITQEVLKKVDCVIDLHSTWSSRIAVCCCECMDGASNDVTRRAMEIVKTYGLTSIIKSAFPKGSLLRYAMEDLGMPGMFSECGAYGFGEKARQALIERNITGIRNVMIHLGMIEDRIIQPEKQILVAREARAAMKAAEEGHFCPEIGIDRLGDSVKEGELLGRTVSPHSFEELERFEAPYAGICHLVRGHGPIFSGDWAYSIADLRKVEWIKKEES